jgi:predicted DNA-binding antitoxin AbrB/MazE fold protein
MPTLTGTTALIKRIAQERNMGQTVRAVYERGYLRLLEKVALAEGQEVHISILSNRDLIRQALGDLVVKYPDESDDVEDFDEEALLAEVAAAFEGLPPLSETIIAERREGP